MIVTLTDGRKVILQNYIDLESKDKIAVLEMRNHLEVRKWMYGVDKISLSEHLGFIDSLKYSLTKQYFLIKLNNKSIGTVYFIDKDDASDSIVFGFFANPFNVMLGTGRILEHVALYYVFNVLKMRILKLEVFSDNKQVINLHRKNGFIVTGTKLVSDREVSCMELKKLVTND